MDLVGSPGLGRRWWVARVALVPLLVPVLVGCSPAGQPTSGESVVGPSAGTGSPQLSPPATASPPARRCRWASAADEPVKTVGNPPASPPVTGTAIMSITTNRGLIEVRMDPAKTPCAIASFSHLAGAHFFDGSACHRLVDQGLHLLQCGDPSGSGRGGPDYAYLEENLPVLPGRTTSLACMPPPADPLPDGSCPPGSQPVFSTEESGQSPPPPPDLAYPRGTVGVANLATPGTSGSQFFVCYRDNVMPAWYTQLGTVTKGMQIIDAIAAGGLQPKASRHDGKPRLALVLQSVTVTYT